MATVDSKNPTRLERSRDRLRRAVARLEEVLNARAAVTAEGERKLAKQVAAAKAENSELRELNAAVSRRVDLAIGRLKAMLEG